MISHETYLYEELSAEENLRFYGKMYKLDEPFTGLDIKANLKNFNAIGL